MNSIQDLKGKVRNIKEKCRKKDEKSAIWIGQQNRITIQQVHWDFENIKILELAREELRTIIGKWVGESIEGGGCIEWKSQELIIWYDTFKS